MEAIAVQAPGRARRLGLLAYLWLMAGFAAGTALLVGPVGWLSRASQRRGWAERLAETTLSAERRAVRVGIPTAATVLAALALWAWMNPGRMLAAVAGGDE